MVDIREARVSESEYLTKIAIKSEAYLGFDYDYMEKFKEIYKVTEAFINGSITFIIEKDCIIIGFYSILMQKDKNSLEYFFILPEFIGKGYGRLLWNHMVKTCVNKGIEQVEIVTSPESKEFYIKMGATQIGEVESIVKTGRMIPKLRYSV